MKNIEILNADDVRQLIREQAVSSSSKLDKAIDRIRMIEDAVDRLSALIAAIQRGDKEDLTVESQVNKLKIGVRPLNVFSNVGIVTIGQLITQTPQELLKYRNIGKHSLRLIRMELARFGFKLAGD